MERDLQVFLLLASTHGYEARIYLSNGALGWHFSKGEEQWGSVVTNAELVEDDFDLAAIVLQARCTLEAVVKEVGAAPRRATPKYPADEED